MSISTRISRYLVYIAISSCAVAASIAQAAGPFRAGQCTGCTTLPQLQARAQAIADATVYYGVERSGTVYVTSNVSPISAQYFFTSKKIPSSSQDDPRRYAILSPVTLTIDQAGELDEVMFARKVQPVQIPSSIATSADGRDAGKWADIGTYVRGVLPVNFGPTIGYYLKDSRTQENIPLRLGLRITVRFPDGSTAQLIWNGQTHSTDMWELVPGSERDPDGNPYTGYTGGSGGSGGDGSQFVFNGRSYAWSSTPAQCSIRTTVCVAGSCFTRRVPFNCM